MLQDFFSFDKMLTPQIIKIVYVLGLLAVVLSSIGNMLMAGASGIVFGLVTLVLGVIGVRIWCELLIVIFKINENLKKITDLKESSATVEKAE